MVNHSQPTAPAADRPISVIALEMVTQHGANAPAVIAEWVAEVRLGPEAAKFWRDIIEETHRILLRRRHWLKGLLSLDPAAALAPKIP